MKLRSTRTRSPCPNAMLKRPHQCRLSLRAGGHRGSIYIIYLRTGMFRKTTSVQSYLSFIRIRSDRAKAKVNKRKPYSRSAGGRVCTRLPLIAHSYTTKPSVNAVYICQKAGRGVISIRIRSARPSTCWSLRVKWHFSGTQLQRLEVVCKIHSPILGAEAGARRDAFPIVVMSTHDETTRACAGLQQ